MLLCQIRWKKFSLLIFVLKSKLIPELFSSKFEDKVNQSIMFLSHQKRKTHIKRRRCNECLNLNHSKKRAQFQEGLAFQLPS